MPNDTIPEWAVKMAARITTRGIVREYSEALEKDIGEALVVAERRGLERGADAARRIGSEYNWLWNDNVEPEANKNRRDGAYAAETAIRKLMESSDGE